MEVQNLDKKAMVFEYENYIEMVSNLFKEGRVTGENQSEALLQTTAMNLHRYARIEKTGKLTDATVVALKSINKKISWTVLVEGWCADASQNLPFIVKMARESDNIDLKLVLRDENLSLMDQYLTNGARAVPKLICTDVVSGEVLGTWGARPTTIQEKVLAFKKENPEVSKIDFTKFVQKLYGQDKGESIQKDFINLIHKWK
ncbi:thioredoxin family protein [Bacteroidota bacterium]